MRFHKKFGESTVKKVSLRTWHSAVPYRVEEQVRVAIPKRKKNLCCVSILPSILLARDERNCNMMNKRIRNNDNYNNLILDTVKITNIYTFFFKVEIEVSHDDLLASPLTSNHKASHGTARPNTRRRHRRRRRRKGAWRRNGEGFRSAEVVSWSRRDHASSSSRPVREPVSTGPLRPADSQHGRAGGS